MKIFIIDDSLTDLESLRRHFEPDFDVLPNNTEEELKEYSDAFKDEITLKSYVDKVIQQQFRDIRLIVSDMYFDGDMKDRFNGIDLIQHIRSMSKTSIPKKYFEYIPIIATSRVAGNTYLQQAYLQAKATLYIDKDVKDDKGKIMGLNSMGTQLINPFDDWCNMLGLCRYKVGFSFAGMDKKKKEPHRRFVKEIAESLCIRCAIPVFFDEFRKAEINVQNGETLASIYRNQCENIVVFLSDDYNDPNSNVWTSDEWQSGIGPYIKETSLDKLCLLNVSDGFKKEDVLSRMFHELNTTTGHNSNTQHWDRIYQDIHEQRKSLYNLYSTDLIPPEQCFEKYYTVFRNEKLKQIVDFIIKRFHLVEIN